MTHLNPSLIEIMLRKENEGAFLKEPDEQPLQPFKYFIPFRFMQRSHSDLLPVKGSGADEVYEPRKDENGLRDDLHNFVFVYADADRVRKLSMRLGTVLHAFTCISTVTCQDMR